jgi:hypothetical protein
LFAVTTVIGVGAEGRSTDAQGRMPSLSEALFSRARTAPSTQPR